MPVEYLSGFFDTLEINTSFSGPPKPRPRAPGRRTQRRISAFSSRRSCGEALRTRRTRRLAGDEKLVREGMAPLVEAGRLGAVLMQFPISFQNTPENRQYVADLQRRFRELPLVVEVRHRSWADEAALEFLTELGIGFCNIDQPLLGKALRPTAETTSAVGYVRLHGRNYQNWFAENKRVAATVNLLSPHLPRLVGPP